MKLPKAKYQVSDEKHKYTIKTDDGKTVGPLKSVTSVLDVLNKPALIGWAARETALFFKTEILRLGQGALNTEMLEIVAKDAAGAHRRKAKDAADLGTKCHDAFEAIILGREPEALPAELAEPANAFKNWRLGSDVEIVSTEISVGSLGYLFGGRLDALGYSKKRGGWGIVDYKTSSGFYGNEYAYQVGGYALAFEEMFGVDVAWAEIVRFSKKPPFESEARPVLDLAAAQAGFLSALAMTRSKDLDLIGDPSFESAGIPVPAVSGKAAALPMGF